MDTMFYVQLAVVLLFIFIGAKFGGIGIGFAGAAGVLVLSLVFGLPVYSTSTVTVLEKGVEVVKTSNNVFGYMPVDVILIIMAVIATVSAMQVAGGMDWMVGKAEKFLRSNPKRITFYAPIVTYLMTLFAGTGHTAFSTLPVIAEVAKGQGIRPSRPLSISVVSSQIAITASPVSAAVVAFSGMMEPLKVGYLTILLICIPTTFLACLVGAFVSQFLGKELKDDPIYQSRLAQGLCKNEKITEVKILPTGKLSVIIFFIAIIAVILYATLISDVVLKSNFMKSMPNVQAWLKNPPMLRDNAIVLFMMTAACAIVSICKVDTAKILQSATFKSGMSAAMCVLGVAWLGNVLVQNHINEIKAVSSNVLNQYPWLLAVALFFASMLLYSQAATTRALMPAAIALAVSPVSLVAAFAAVSALFVLPTYPTLLAAVEMDDTGSTRIGKYVFDHPFFIPGVATIIAAVSIGYVIAGIVL